MATKHIHDYWDRVHEKFPDLCQKDFERIMSAAFRSLYRFIATGADVLLSSRGFKLFIGVLLMDKKLYWDYYNVKRATKLRIKYFCSRKPYNGYYYFGVSEEDYKKYKLNKKGRKSVVFPEITLFKIQEEAYLNLNHKYFYKVSIQEDPAFKLKKENYKATGFALIATRGADLKIKPV